jgi:hypothetical protein
MQKNILHYSLLASTSVLAVVVILLGFSQYDIAMNLQGENEAAATKATQVVYGNTYDAGVPLCKAGDHGGCIKNPVPIRAATAIWNSFYSANLSPTEANGTTIVGQNSRPEGSAALPKPQFAPFADYQHTSTSCKNPITITSLKQIIAFLTYIGADTSKVNQIISTSNQYIMGGDDIHYAIINALGYDGNGAILAGTKYAGWQLPFAPPYFAYCLDAGYVSNYPNYVQKFTAFLSKYNLTTMAVNNQLFPFGGAPAITSGNGSIIRSATPITALPNTVNTSSTGTTGTGTPVPTSYNSQPPTLGSAPTAPTITSATSSKAYTVSVDYSHFNDVAQAANGYTSVYTATGTKSVSITVFKFPNGSSLTANQAIAQLNTLGYRPATLSELYALKTAQPSVGSSVVGLGTNTGSSYGYPTSSGVLAEGMGRSAGPFSTTLYSFAAVKNN